MSRLVPCILVVATACSGSGERAAQPTTATTALAEALLPVEPGRFAPAHTRLAEGAAIDGTYLADTESCAGCHPDAAAQWQASAHGFASFNNPVYRVSINGFRARAGAVNSRFCAGCHDVALLVDQAMDTDIQASDPRAHAGITCRICHGITAITADGNGSFTLTAEPLFEPRENDPASVERHRRAVSRKTLGNDLCLPCHRSFLGPESGAGHHLTGMDDFLPWQSSPFAGQGAARVDTPVAQNNCIGCHMAREPAPEGDVAAKNGTIASHRFTGGHTWLAAMIGDSNQLARAQEFLQGVTSIDIARAVSRDAPGAPGVLTLPADGAPVPRGGVIELDVVVRNLAVGHRFPGGVRDAQDTWIAVEVRDADGALVASSGAGDDNANAHVLRSLVADQGGALLFARQVDRFAAPVMDHTLLPRDAHGVRYQFAVPETIRQPVQVTARLLHRSRNRELATVACREEQGSPFAAGSREARGVFADPCVPRPVTEMAATEVRLGAGSQARPSLSAPRPAWQRLYEHGLAWSHSVQERLDEARPSLQAALDALDAVSPDAADAAAMARSRAMVMAALARVSGRQGRTAEALDWLDRAEVLLPGHPALAAIRADALMRVWRWREAEAPLSALARAVPQNRGAWADLAVTLGSLGKDREALEAARRGLVLVPRDEVFLRVQAVVLQSGGAPEAERALAAYDRHRAWDGATTARFACMAQSALCAREREPVHTHVLVPAVPERGPGY